MNFSARTLGLCALLACPTTLLATSPSAFNWAIQNTGYSANSYSHIGVTFRDGIWPVLVNDNPTSIYSLFATGTYGSSSNTSTGSWQPIGSSYLTNSGYIHTASSLSTGQFAYVIPYSNSYITDGGVCYGSSIQALPVGTQAVAFDSAGTLYTATKYAITNAPAMPQYFISGNINDLAVSRSGDIGAVANNGYQIQFVEYNHWLHAWNSVFITSATGQSFQTGSLNFEYDSLGLPHILGVSYNSLIAYDFSIATNTWVSTVLFTSPQGTLSTLAALAANDTGTIGTVYSDGSTLYYAYKNGNNGWQSVAIPTNTTVNAAGGLAYDSAGNPVVGFASNGQLMLAYDPVTIPEPASLGLLLLGGLTLMTRRR